MKVKTFLCITFSLFFCAMVGLNSQISYNIASMNPPFGIAYFIFSMVGTSVCLFLGYLVVKSESNLEEEL